MIKSNRAIWLDYLRAFITVLVVAHHSSLAYTTFASFNKAAYNASTHPIVDCGIYLIHYIFVLWSQFLLLPVALPAVVKFALTFIISLSSDKTPPRSRGHVNAPGLPPIT